MKTTLAHKGSLLLLRLYPRAWRERYAEEATAVLEEHPVTWKTLSDLFLGMLDAYMHNELFTERKFVMIQRMRNSQVNIFLSLVFFLVFWSIYSLAGSSIYRFGVPAWDLTSPMPNYTFVFPLVRRLGLLALATTLLGGGAFIAAALKQACARNQLNIPPVACTLISILAVAQFFALLIIAEIFQRGWSVLGLSLFCGAVLFLLFTLLANALRLRQGIKYGLLSLRFMSPTLVPGLSITAIAALFSIPFVPRLSFYFFASIYRNILSVLLMVMLIGILSSSVIYLARQLRRVAFTPRFLRFTFALAGLTTLTMLTILGLLLYEALIIYQHVNTNGMKLLSLPLLLAIVVCIALPTIFSCVSLWRGLTARREMVMA